MRKPIKRSPIVLLLCLAAIAGVLSGLPAKSASNEKSSPVNLIVGDFCGNGAVGAGEECDDGNNISGDGCSDICITEFCGDNIVNNGEVCDANNQACTAGGYAGAQLCNPTCAGWLACVPSESCGDGIINGAEVCDDNNNLNCDGCRSDCTRPDGICGDGYLECGEECDGDLGVTPGYTCTSSCTLEQVISAYGFIMPDMFSELSIYNLASRIGTNEADISWNTNKSVACSLSYGHDSMISDGIIEETEKKTQHQISIYPLLADTLYFYQIDCADIWGHKATTGIKSFRTETMVDIIAPPNVDGFISELQDLTVRLVWKNPSDPDFMAVKIVRSEDSFIADPSQGLFIYNDRGESFVDADVAPGKTYYYTAFTYDDEFNYSSGAITSIRIPDQGVSPEEIRSEDDKKEDDHEIRIIVPAPRGKDHGASNEEKVDISWDDMNFYIANQAIQIHMDSSSTLQLLPGIELGIDIEASKLPRSLKSIIISINDAADKNSSNYLLKINNDDTRYGGNITVPRKPGNYQIYVSIYDFRSKKLTRLAGFLTVAEFGQIKDFFSDTGTDAVPGALISLFSYDEGQIRKWQANDYSQFNPLLSNQLGQYGFIVPNGRYQLKAEKEGYLPYSSPVFKISNNIINNDIDIYYLPKVKWIRWSWLCFIVFTVYLTFRLWIKKNRYKK